MNAGEIGFLAFGGALVVLFALIVRHYYARGRKAKVEQAKYKMLDDE
jgi:cbb3-type cytochrome oxidase subunit 3